MDLHNLTCSCDASFSCWRLQVLLKMQPTAAHVQTQHMLKTSFAHIFSCVHNTSSYTMRSCVRTRNHSSFSYSNSLSHTLLFFSLKSSQVISVPPCHDVIMRQCFLVGLSLLTFPSSVRITFRQLACIFLVLSFMDSLLSLTRKTDVHLSHYLAILHTAHCLWGWQAAIYV